MKIYRTSRPIFLILTLASLLAASSVSAATHTVCASGCHYTSIQAAVDASSADDVLELEPETFTESDIFIDLDLTIRSASGMAIIDADGEDTVFKILGGSEVTLEDLRLEGASLAQLLNHGDTTLSTVYVYGFAGTTDKGGIFNGVAASLLITDASLLAGNESTGTYTGGGVTNYGDLEIENSTVNANEGSRGGGVYNSGGQVSVSSSSFSFNHSTIRGGAWWSSGGSFIFHSSASYSGNTSTGTCDKYWKSNPSTCVD